MISRLKTVLAAICIGAVMAGVLCTAGCAFPDAVEGTAGYRIVCTTFPQYDWVKQVVGDSQNFEVELLLRNGADMHSFQPSVNDMYRIATADMFIYVGGSSDTWVDDALGNSRNDNMKVINMMELIGDSVKVEEIVEGMQDDEGTSLFERWLHSFGTHIDDEELEYDEHMWLSISNAIIVTGEIAAQVASLDSGNADIYAANAKAYIEKLTDLDDRYKQAAAASRDKTVLFGDRFPFRYLADEYGLTYYAAFAGCSTETEASFDTVVYLSGKIDEMDLSVIYVIENSDKRVAEAIKRNSASDDIQILTMNSMQSVTDKDIAAGASYLNYMEENLLALQKGL